MGQSHAASFQLAVAYEATPYQPISISISIPLSISISLTHITRPNTESTTVRHRAVPGQSRLVPISLSVDNTGQRCQRSQIPASRSRSVLVWTGAQDSPKESPLLMRPHGNSGQIPKPSARLMRVGRYSIQHTIYCEDCFKLDTKT